MSSMLNVISDFYFRAHRSRIFTALVILMFIVCSGLIAAAQPETGLDLRIYSLTEKTSITASIDLYFNVQGRLIPDGRYQTTRSLGPFQLTGSRYIPIQVAGRDELIFVLDENVPGPDANGFVSFIGKLNPAGDPEVNYYLAVERPTDIPLINRIARVALVVASLIALGLVGGWLVRRANYALAASGEANPAAASPEWLWFGNLGARFQNAYLRQAPVRLSTAQQEVTFESAGKEPWAVVVRHVQHTTPLSVATAFGTLPAIRLRFEDERGLMRNGVVAASTTQARDALLQKLITNN